MPSSTRMERPVKLDCTISQLANEFSRELEALNYTFNTNRHRSRLQLKDGKRIMFPNDAGGRGQEGAKKWVRAKHRNGKIHEPALVASFVALSRRLRDEPIVFFDVGALYGYFSLVVKSLFPQSTAFAFEVNPNSYEALRKVVAANKHLGSPAVHCCNVGLSDHTRLSHPSSVRGLVLDEDTAGGETVVDLMRLDDFSRVTSFLPDLMKVDVEGYQARILPGAMDMIAAAKPTILMEFDAPQVLERFGLTNADIVRPLFDLGYSMLWTSDHRDGSLNKFEHLRLADLTTEHETNSLAVFVQAAD